VESEAIRQKQIKDRSAEDRQFKTGDKVLLLLPRKENKLEIAWRGPFVVLSRVGDVDYKLRVGTKPKLYHANLLRRYYDREETAVIRVVVEEEVEGPSPGESDLGGLPSLPLRGEEGPSDVVISPDLDPDHREQLESVLASEAEGLLTDLTGSTVLVECELVVLSPDPVRVRQYPLPHAQGENVREEVAAMIKLGVIEPAVSPYNAPVVLVKKKDGKISFCIDYR